MNKDWSLLNKLMQKQLKKKDTFNLGIQTLILLRNQLMLEIDTWIKRVDEQDFHKLPFINSKGYECKNIAYSLWHIFRIEDIVTHSLIQKNEQVFYMNNYHKRMNAKIETTGNELKGIQISEFTQDLDINELYNYIHDVKTHTDSYLEQLNFNDLFYHFNQTDIERIKISNNVSTDQDAYWLIDYWCSKNILGLIQMPLSRHWIMHVEASIRIINRLNKK